MWDQSSGSQFSQIIQSLMQNPQVYQRLMQLMSQQRTAGIGSLQPRQGGGPMPMGQNLAMQVPQGGMPRANGPSPYGGQPPQGGVWGAPRAPVPQPLPQAGGLRPGGTTLDSYPRMGGGYGPSSSPPVDAAAAWRQASNWMQPATPMPAPTTGYGGAQSYQPAPFSPPSQPKAYGAPAPTSPGLAQNGTSGLDWYAMQAGN